MTCYLEIGVNGVKLFGVLGELGSDVFGSNKDALQVRPCPLNFEPYGDD